MNPGSAAAPLRRSRAQRSETIERLHPPARAQVWTGPGSPHETRVYETVRLAPGDVLVAVELAAICGSDVHTVAGDRPGPAPAILGHETVGRVVAIGPEPPRAADGSGVRVGDRVVWSITVSCGACDRCRRGMPQKCRTVGKYGHEALRSEWELSGGFATHVHVRRGTTVVRVDDTIPATVLAPLGCGVATAWAAMDRVSAATDARGSAVIVVGAGMVGLAATAIAADRGATVVVVEPDDARRRRAEDFGAAFAVHPGDGASAVRRLLAARGVLEVAAAVEASGSAAGVRLALDLLDVDGIAVLVGSVSPGPTVALDPERMVRNLLTVAGVHNYSPAHLEAAARWIADAADRRPFAQLVGAVLPLDAVDRAVGMARSGEHVRVAVRP